MNRSAIDRYVPVTLFAAASIVLAAFAVGPELFGQGKTKDYPLWFWVGRQVLSGGDIYTATPGGGFRFIYPPFAALLMAPISAMGRAPMYASLVVVNIAAWWACLELGARLEGDRQSLPWWALALPSVLLLASIFDMFDLGQPNMALLAMVLAGLWLTREKKPIAGGALFAAAAAIKAFPVAILPYLLWRRRWRAAIAMTGFLAVFLVLAPAPFIGFQRNLGDLATWTRGMVLSSSQQGFGQRPQQNWGWKNQSMIAVGNRLLRPIDAETPGRPSIQVNVFDLSFGAANAVVIALAALIGVGFAALMPSDARRTPASDAAEWGALVALATIASPLARQYYFVWLLFPVTVLVRRAASDGDGRTRTIIWTALGLAFVLMALSLPWPGSHLVQAAGNNLAATAILIGVLIWLMRRDARRPSEQRS
jgi:hypothetical protein